MTNNTDPQNPEAGRAPSQSEQSLQHNADMANAVSQRKDADHRFFEITFTRTAHYVSVMTVEARSQGGAEDIAKHVLSESGSLEWDRIGNEIDILSVDEVNLGGRNE